VRTFERNTLERFADVLAAAQARDPVACRRLYESLAGRVHGYLRSRGAREPEDLTSEVFLRVFERLPAFEGDEAGLRAWVFTIAHRLLIDEYRRSCRRPVTVALPAPLLESINGGDVEMESMIRFGADHAERVVAGLPPDQGEVITLRVLADLSIEQVARVVGKRPGAVKALQHRALATLRRRIEEVTA
jgi:RNA polymerase sigma-70 factor (ECF subfamily)